MKTYYDILGIAETASTQEIKSAYRKLVKRFHPDVAKNNGQDTSKFFEEISVAYTALHHPEKRKEYDSQLKTKRSAISPLKYFRFREWKDWLASFSLLKLLISRKIVSREQKQTDPGIMALSVDELLQRVLYSRNIYVQTHAVRALFAKGKRYAVSDLLRLLYSNIHETVKIEILEGLKTSREDKVKRVIREIYDIEKSLKIRQMIRSTVKI